jgi:hypothetical protein
MTVEQIYEQTIRALPAGDQLRLASLIMWQFAGTGGLDYSEEWADDDLRDFAADGQELIERRLRDEAREGAGVAGVNLA